MFTVAADAYDRYMGRYSIPLAPEFCEFSQIAAGQRVLDVGCGPGALTAELVKRLGPAGVSAVDPSEPFVEAARERHPGVDVRQAAAELLPFPDGVFDASLAQLVVHFMASPIEGLSEMARVTRPGGVVAACVWDHDAGGEGALSRFWEAARELDPEVEDESELAGSRRGHLAELLREAGLEEVEETGLSVSVEHATFDEWWEPFTFGVGTVGAYLSQLDQEQRTRLREHCRSQGSHGKRSGCAVGGVCRQPWLAHGRHCAPNARRRSSLRWNRQRCLCYRLCRCTCRRPSCRCCPCRRRRWACC
jgi:ubiquinone/menaquinone biosynthesis C-methylase UbiE